MSYGHRLEELEKELPVSGPSVLAPPAPAGPGFDDAASFDVTAREEALKQSRLWAVAAIEADSGGRSDEAILAYRTTVRHLEVALSHMTTIEGEPVASRMKDYGTRLSVLEEAKGDHEANERDEAIRLHEEEWRGKWEAEQDKAREVWEAEANAREVAAARSRIAQIPDAFYCPISFHVMTDPVICADGHTYERASIESWLLAHNTSPKTNEALSTTDLIPNHTIRAAIDEWRQLQGDNDLSTSMTNDDPEATF